LVVTGAAFAQSSVSLYGVVDAGMGRLETGSRSTPPGNDASSRIQMTSGSLLNNGNSRFGLRGVEDLGSGLQAGFNLEAGLDLDDGASLGSGGGPWGRMAIIWLSGPYGTHSRWVEHLRFHTME